MQATRYTSLNEMRFGAVSTQGLVQLAEADAARIVQSSLEEHADMERAHLRCPQTRANWEKAHTEFSEFLFTVFGDAESGWQQCTPDHVLTYLYLLMPFLHTGRGGGKISHSHAKKLVSSISMESSGVGVHGVARSQWCLE